MTSNTKHLPQEPAVACTLDANDFGARRNEIISQLFARALSTEELDDGYTFHFPGDAETARQLTEFVLTERECCQFFTFDLTLEPEHGPIHLQLRGPEGTKLFVEGLIL